MGTIESLSSLAMIFIMIIPGFVLGRSNKISEEQTLGLTGIVVNLTWPCLVISAMQIPFSFNILFKCGYISIVMLVLFAVAITIAIVLVKIIKINKTKSYIFIAMVMFSNTGFMGIPIINAIYGGVATFYASIVELVSNVFILTIGISLIQMSAGKSLKMNLKEFLTPGFVAVVIGFLLFVLNVTLPGFLGDSVTIIGSATTPLTMVIIGLQISRMKIIELFNSGLIYVTSFLALIVIPVICFVIFFVILKDTSLLAKVVTLQFAMPIAMCIAIFSQQYGADHEFASKGILISTMLSIATLPLFTILVNL